MLFPHGRRNSSPPTFSWTGPCCTVETHSLSSLRHSTRQPNQTKQTPGKRRPFLPSAWCLTLPHCTWVHIFTCLLKGVCVCVCLKSQCRNLALHIYCVRVCGHTGPGQGRHCCGHISTGTYSAHVQTEPTARDKQTCLQVFYQLSVWGRAAVTVSSNSTNDCREWGVKHHIDVNIQGLPPAFKHFIVQGVMFPSKTFKIRTLDTYSGAPSTSRGSWYFGSIRVCACMRVWECVRVCRGWYQNSALCDTKASREALLTMFEADRKWCTAHSFGRLSSV